MGLVDQSGVRPTKAGFFFNEKKGKTRKERRRTFRSREALVRTLSELSGYDGFELCDPIDGNFTNVSSDMSFDQNGLKRKYAVSRDVSEFSIEKAISHVRLFCMKLTPRYGFSIVGPNFDISCLAAGITTTGMERETSFRTSALGASLLFGKQHLKGRVADVFGLNILSEVHLAQDIDGQSLADWIVSGRHGTLTIITDRVAVWTVPKEIRQSVRARLWRSGMFIDDNQPEIFKLNLSHITPA